MTALDAARLQARDETCEHHSSRGIDDTPLGDPYKFWRCDECGAVRCYPGGEA